MPSNIKFLFLGLLSGLLAAALILLVSAPDRGKNVVLLPTPEPAEWVIYVTGAVQSPGVYQVPAGSRVEAGIKAAGGLVENADANALNLAAFVSDGATIYVPVSGESPSIELPGVRLDPITVERLININTASVEILDTLPGIGPAKAAEIVAYRQKIGAFDTIEEIQDVPGIGPGLFEEIRDRISVADHP